MCSMVASPLLSLSIWFFTDHVNINIRSCVLGIKQCYYVYNLTTVIYYCKFQCEVQSTIIPSNQLTLYANNISSLVFNHMCVSCVHLLTHMLTSLQCQVASRLPIWRAYHSRKHWQIRLFERESFGEPNNGK